MQIRISPTLTANPILTLEDLGLERSVGLDQASRGLAERSEAQIVRWVQFPAGALFFTLVPERSGVGCSLCTRPQERGVLPRGLQRPEMGRLQSGRIRGIGTDAPADSCWRSARGCLNGGMTNERRADRQPGPFICAGFEFGL